MCNHLLTLDAGSRGGKRSVTHLSKAQLARKRANDREAQRNIRQRTKEHIENLEKKVKELEEYNRSTSMDRVIRRNKELEAEVEELRAQVAAATSGTTDVVSVPSEIAEEMLLPQKGSLGWSSEPAACSWQGQGAVSSGIPVTSSNYTSNPAQQLFSSDATAISYDDEETEASQPMYSATAIPVWVSLPRFLFSIFPHTLSPTIITLKLLIYILLLA